MHTSCRINHLNVDEVNARFHNTHVPRVFVQSEHLVDVVRDPISLAPEPIRRVCTPTIALALFTLYRTYSAALRFTQRRI